MIKTKELLLILIVTVSTTNCTKQSIFINVDIPNQISNLSKKQIFLNITSEFENFIYQHPQKQSLSIDIGTAQTFLFKKVVKKLFARVQTEGLSPSSTPDFVIKPKLINIELSRPEESGLTSFECRFKYMILIRTQEYVQNHIILAYSRTPKMNKNETQIIAELMSKCIRTIGSKLEIKLLELANEV